MGREHTAEHVLMGALQRVKGSLKVKKVEVSEGSGTVIVEADTISFNDLAQAQTMANRIVSEGRIVKDHFFNSLEEAYKAFPVLRAHEERIQGRVRVVDVDGFDYSACSGEHVKNTRECGMIIVTHVSKSGGTYQIDFAVGEKAFEAASELSALCLSVASILGSTVRNLEKTVVNMKMDNEDLGKRLSAATEKIIEETPLDSEVNGVEIYVGLFKGIDVRTSMKKLGELVEKGGCVYVIGSEWPEKFSILVGSGDERVNAAELIKEVSMLFNGKGGGNHKIAIGSFSQDVLVKAFEAVKTMISKLLTGQ